MKIASFNDHEIFRSQHRSTERARRNIGSQSQRERTTQRMIMRRLTALPVLAVIGLFVGGHADRAIAQGSVASIGPPHIANFVPSCPLPTPPVQSGTIVYTNSTLVSDFTSTVTEYAQFIRGLTIYTFPVPNMPLPYTPTTSIMLQPGFWTMGGDRIFGNKLACSNDPAYQPIVVKFSKPVSKILVFPSIDHVGKRWDAFQYSIWGLTVDQNNDTIGYKLLFDPINVLGQDDPNEVIDSHFTLDQWSGIGPTTVNNWLPASRPKGGFIGYEAYFDFGSGNSYQYYAFTASTLSGTAIIGAEHEVELVAVAEAEPRTGLLKVCKVAGPNVAVGAITTFAIGTSTLAVPAGPAPGGNCVLGPNFLVGSVIPVVENIPPGETVSNIAVAPPGQLIGTPNLATGSVNVTIGKGVTEVTYTDKRTGFVEICKIGVRKGSFTFSISPGKLNPVVVQAGACSPAIEVAPGPITIKEYPSENGHMTGCATIPPGLQGPCNLGTQTSVVKVSPGDVSTQTIAIIENSSR